MSCSQHGEPDEALGTRHQSADGCTVGCGPGGEVCGNGRCGTGENTTNCRQDCPVCGDTRCTGNETLSSCRQDCIRCGDYTCTRPEETASNCYPDCHCGDGICKDGEKFATCPNDCKCGNGTCNRPQETSSNCYLDCHCGDGVCKDGETFSTCSNDCKCGDGTCSRPQETTSTCYADCHCGDNICQDGETFATCGNDCKCGNGVCSSSENILTCPSDCQCGNGVCESERGETATTCGLDCAPTDYVPVYSLPSMPGTGTLAGASSVNRFGAYNYDIDLPLPPGRAGMQPSVSLHYDSNAGEGYVGVGWSIVATSQVRRCRQNPSRDRVSEKVDFDGMTFCLDGEPLVVISTSGTTAEYRTLNDRFARIISDGGATVNKPKRFFVYQKDGKIYEYGINADARAQAITTGAIPLSADPLAWYLSYIVDRSGNYIEYQYKGTDTDTERYLSEILYTGQRGSNGSGYNIQPLRRVRFDYMLRNLPLVRYTDHRPESLTRQLLRVTTIVKSGPAAPDEYVWSYTFDYEPGRSRETQRNLLKQVYRCDNSGVCMNPTKFEYPDSEPPLLPYRLLSSVPLLDRPDKGWWTRLLTMDLNGDGRDEVMYTSVDTVGKSNVGVDLDNARPHRRVALHMGSGSGPGPAIDVSNQFGLIQDPITNRPRFDPFRSRTADINGDGRGDILAFGLNGDFLDFWAYQYDLVASRLIPDRTSVVMPTLGTPDTTSSVLMDVNGDGTLDFVGWTGRAHRYLKLGIPGTLQFQESVLFAEALGAPTNCNRPFWSLDTDNDGRSELVEGCDVGGLVKSYGLSKTGQEEVSTMQTGELPYQSDRWNIVMVDVNGDGLKDQLYHSSAGFFVRLFTGRELAPAYEVVPELRPVPGAPDPFESFGADHVRIGDFNGDGREDLLLLKTGSPTPIADTTFVQRYETAPELLLSDGIILRRAPMVLGSVKIPRLRHHRDDVTTFGWSGTQLADVDGDGSPEIITIDKAADQWVLSTYTRTPEDGARVPSTNVDRLLKVTPAEGLTELIEYEPISNSAVFTPGTTCQSPEYCARRGRVVTSRVEKLVRGTPDAGSQIQSYSYEDGRVNSRGYGFLGFRRIKLHEPGRRRHVTTTYVMDRVSAAISGPVHDLYPGLGRVSSEEETFEVTPDGYPTPHVLRFLTSYQYSHSFQTRSGPGAPYATSNYYTVASNLWGRTTWLYEGNASSWNLVSQKSDSFLDYDAYGNWRHRTSSTVSGETITTGRTIDNDPANWIIGMVRSQVTMSTVPSTQGVSDTIRTRTTDYSYYLDTGLLKTQTIEPNDTTGDQKLTLTYTWKRGQIDSVTRTDARNGWRKRVVHYNTEGVRPIALVNELGHVTKLTWYDSMGLLQSRTDPDSAKHRWEYDTFGRIRTIIPAGSAATRFEYRASAVGSVTVNGSSAMLVEQILAKTDGLTQESYTYLDAGGREVLHRRKAFGGGRVQDFELVDVLGRTRQVTNTHPEADIASAPSTKFGFDALGRMLTTVAPDSSTEEWFYLSLLTTLHADQTGRTTQTFRNVDGRIKKVTSSESSVEYAYGAFGTLAKVTYTTTNAATNGLKTIDNYFDNLGRLTSSTDLNSQIRYNAFSDVEDVQRGEITHHFEHDSMGRVFRASAQNADGSVEDSSFAYDLQPNAIGKISRAQLSANTFVELQFSYDAHGRLTRKTSTYAENLTVDYSYNELGRISKILYPQLNTVASRFGVRHSYDSMNGNLEAVSDSTTGKLYWLATSRSADGLLTADKYGNGVTRTLDYDSDTRRLVNVKALSNNSQIQSLHYEYAADGRVRIRNDAATGIADAFDYDSEGRLREWAASGPRDMNRRYSYWPDGSLQTVFNDQFADGSTQTRTLSYTNPTFPNAVSQDGENSYTYDSLGRQVSQSPLGSSIASREISYTSFDLPKNVTTTNPEVGTQSTTIFYDAFHQRVAKWSALGASVYLDDIFESKISDEGEVDLYRVFGESGPIAEVMIGRESTGATPTVSYLHTDGIGTLALTTNSSGAVQERHYYEPFGRRLTVSAATAPPPTSILQTTLGFTGHDHDDDVGLINMRGRVYDPRLRSFVTRDPIVADPLNPQDHNPYSYVRNSPITLSDPSGFAPSGFECIGRCPDVVGGSGSEADPWEVGAISPSIDGADPKEPSGVSPLGDDGESGHLPISSDGVGIYRDVPQHPVDDLGGLALGFMRGFTPFMSLLPSVPGDEEYERNAAVGEILGGLAAMSTGIGVATGGAFATALGIIPAAVAIPAGAGLATTGAVSVFAGFQRLQKMASRKSSASSSSGKNSRFTSSSFRDGLAERTGINPTGSDAHHVFPQKFEAQFRGKGLEIHDPMYGSWWERGSHQQSSAAYNQEWQDFLGTNPSKSQIFDFGRDIATRYGFSVGF